MAQPLFPLPPLPEDETLDPPLPPGLPVPREPTPLPAEAPLRSGLPQPFPAELIDAAVQERRPSLDRLIPPRERSLPGEVISAGFRGAIPGTIGAFGQAAEAVGLPSVGKPLQRAAKSLRETYPGVFEPGVGAQQPGVTRAIASGVEGLATSIGVSVPTLLATAASGGTGMVPLMAAYILGSPAVLSAATYQQFYDAALKAGVSQDIAGHGALKAAVAEAIPEVISNTLGTLLISRGLTKAASKAIVGKITGELGKDASLQAALKPTIAATLANVGTTALVESATEGVTQTLQEKIAADMGMPMESTLGESLGAGLVAGAIFGTLGRGGARFARGRDLKTLSNPDTPADARQEVATKIGEQIQAQDPELGQSFLDFTTRAIQNQEAIPIGVPFREMLAGVPAPAPATTAPPPPPPPAPTGPVQQEAMAEPPIETVVQPPPPGIPVPAQPATPPLAEVQQEAMAEPPIETVVPPPPTPGAAEPPVGVPTHIPGIPVPRQPPVEPLQQEAMAEPPIETVVAPSAPSPQPMPTPSAAIQQVAQRPAPTDEIRAPAPAPAPQIQPSAAVQQIAQTPPVTATPTVEPTEETPGAPTAWYAQLPEPQREAAFEVMRQANEEIARYSQAEQALHPRRGEIAVGATAFDEFIRGERVRVYLRALRQGANPDTALNEATAAGREAVRIHNSRRADVNWQRAEETGEDVLQRVHQRVLQATVGGPAAAVPLPRTGDVPNWPVDRIEVDADRFQFKQASGQGGRTGSLADIDRYNPDLQGVMLVWQDPARPPDADPFVVNGHNRLDAARRFGQPTHPVRFVQASTVQAARAAGALSNIADGKGTIFDAAKFFRDTGTGREALAAQGIALHESHAQQALALANLHPFLFAEAHQGRFPQERAILIGERILDPQRQLDFVKLLEDRARKGVRLTNEAVREFIDFTLNTPTTTTTEETLFGVDERTASLALDKARLSDYIRKRLRDEKRIFGTVGQETAATELARAGNVIDVAGSQAIAAQAATALDLYDRLKLLSGPVGDTLNAAAEALGRGESRRTVEPRTYDRILDVLRTTLPAGAAGSPAGAAGVPAGSPTPAGPEPGPGARLSTTPAGAPTGLTEAAIAAVFPGQSVTPLPNGAFRVTLPHGFVDLVGVESIPMGEAQAQAFEVGYGLPWDPSRTIAGRFSPAQPASSGVRIELVQGASDRLTLRHEVQHFLEHSGLLTPQEIQILEAAMQRSTRGRQRGTEARAQWVAEKLNARDYRQDSAWGQVLDRVWAFFDALLALAGLQTSRGVLRRIATGAVFRAPTTPAPASAVEQFAVAPPQPQVHERLKTEHKLLVDTMGFLTMATPEIIQKVADLDLTRVKYVVPTDVRQQAASDLLESWARNTALYQAAVNNFKRGNLGSSVEHEAWRMIGKRQMEMLTVAMDQMPADEFDALLKQMIGPNSHFRNVETAIHIAESQASEAGRILRSEQDIPTEQRILARLIPLRDKIHMDAQEFKDWLTQAQVVISRNDPQEVNAFMNSIKEPTLRDYLMELRYGSMLIGPSTQIANLGGNIFWNFFNQGVLRPMEGFLDGFLVKGLQGREQQRFVSETWPAITGMATALNPLGTLGRQRWKIVPAFIKGGHEAIQDLPGVEGRGLLIASKLERDMGQHQEVWRKARWGTFDHPALEQAGLYNRDKAVALLKRAGIEPGQPIGWARFLAPAITLALRAMTAMDILTGLAAYDAEIAGHAQRQAEHDLRAGRLEGQTLRDARDHYIQHPTEPMHQQALARTQYLTFTDEPSRVARWIFQGRHVPGLGFPLHVLMPFVATPDRLIARAIELIPGVGLFPQREILYQGTTSPDLAGLMARQLAGTVLALMAFGLYESGRLTGAPPEDDAEREAFYRQGKQAYAIQLGDTWLSYRRFEPLNLTLSLIAVTSQATQRAQEQGKPNDVLSLTAYTGMAMTQHVLEASYFSGLQTLFSALQGRSDAAQVIGRQVDSFIPFQGLRATLQRSVDAYTTERGSILRNPRAFWHHITGIDAIADVALKYNVWGEPIVIPGTVTAQFLPYRFSTASRDPVESELARLQLYPSPPSKRDAAGDLLPQTTYDALAQTRGQLAKGRLDALVSLPSWPLLADTTRTKLIKDALREASAQARRNLQTPTLPGLPVSR